MNSSNTRCAIRFFALNLCIGVCAFAAFGQQPVATPTATPTPTAKQEQVIDEGGDVIRVDSKLVAVPVSVTDQNGQPVQNLTAEDFQLSEEGQRQKIDQVSTAEQVPLEIALLFDVSSSVNKIFEVEKNAAASFLQNVMKPEDCATLFLINEKPGVSVPRTTSEEMAVKVRQIPPASMTTATAFYDTVTAAADYLKKNAPQRSRRVVLVLSDGEDNFSRSTREPERIATRNLKLDTLTTKDLDNKDSRLTKVHLQAQAKVLQDLQANDTVFYSINPSGPSVRLNVGSQRAQNGMQRFADQTGGTAFLPQILQVVAGQPMQSSENEKRNQANLELIFRQIAAELRAQYLLQFYSEGNFQNGKYVTLNVNLPAKNGLRVRARQGYFAGVQTEAK